ncbi:MAG TPA: PASTA domain-containing protein [Draconibacterium sp.]|nr:PASTA domain-containing protein [Draconibacterium sp.]
MSFKKFLTSRVFFLNLLLAVVVVFVLLFATMSWIKSYTHHGITYSVPGFSGMTFEAADELAKENSLKLEIMDSVYNKFSEPGAVIDQVPKAGKKVKEGRVIYLTMNALEPEKVKLPRLTDISFRQAQVLLDNAGITIDNIIYQPSEYNDLVLKVEQDTSEVNEGDMLVKGSSVVVVVGQSKGNMETPLPDLKGLFLGEARKALTNARLNLGVIIYDQSVHTENDTLNARIWKQMPDRKITSKVYLGSSVDLWLSVDPERFNTETSSEQN